MSGSKVENNAAAVLLGKQHIFSKPSKSGKLRTIRRNPKVTDYEWNQNTSSGMSSGSKSGSGRSSVIHPLTQISSQIGNMSISNESNMAPFPKAQVGRPTMMFQQPSKSTVTDQMYVTEASINFSKAANKPQTTPMKISPFKVDNDAMRTTEQIFEFLWDVEPQPKGDSPKRAQPTSSNPSYRL